MGVIFSFQVRCQFYHNQPERALNYCLDFVWIQRSQSDCIVFKILPTCEIFLTWRVAMMDSESAFKSIIKFLRFILPLWKVKVHLKHIKVVIFNFLTVKSSLKSILNFLFSKYSPIMVDSVHFKILLLFQIHNSILMYMIFCLDKYVLLKKMSGKSYSLQGENGWILQIFDLDLYQPCRPFLLKSSPTMKSNLSEV